MYNKLLEILIAIGLIAGAWFYAGHRAVAEYKQEQLIEQAFATQQQQDKYNDLAHKYETLRDTRTDNARTIIREVEKVVDRPVYRTNCIDSTGMQIANDSIAGKGASKPDAKLQAADTP